MKTKKTKISITRLLRSGAHPRKNLNHGSVIAFGVSGTFLITLLQPTAPKPSSATTVKKAGAGAASQAQAAATATRKQCKGTLYKALESVFAPSAGNATNAHARADEYAQQVEDTVFEHFADPGGQPKQKYLSRIRQLLFNLKTSELLRTRVALGQVPAVKFANLSMDELLTPEQRALADSVRARSLKDAVKQDDSSQPRIRTTHKGQELIGEDQSSDATFRVPQPGSAGSPTSPDKAFFEQRQQEELESREGSLAQSPRTTAASPPHQMSPKATSQEAPLSPSASADDQLDDPGSASENRRRSVQFDFDSVWSSVQAQSPPQDTIGASGPQSPMDTSAPAEPDVYDPFDFGKADDAPISTTPPMSPAASSSKAHSGTANPQPTVPTYDPCKTIQEFSTIWSGSVSMPEEGSFPARAVQVGGRPLGQSPVVWQSVIPSKMSMEGRLPTKNASEYLVQCSFAPTREIVVLALLPEQAEGMSAEEAKAKHQYFIDMFTRRDRNGVVPPAQHRRRVVKDCYVVPLRAAEETLPEYIELLDSHALGEKGERKADLLLAVFVLNKGLIPSPHEQTAQGNQPPPSVTSASISGYGSPFPDSTGPLSSAASVTSTHPAAATPAPTLAEPPPAFDPAALSSLMSRAMHFQLNRVLKADCAPTEPSLLASLVASASNAALQSGSTVSSNPPPPIPPYGGSTGNQPYHGPPPTGPALPPYQPPPHADDYYREYPAPYAAREQGHSYSPPRRSGRDAPPFRGRGGGPRGGFQDNGFRGRGRGRGGPPRGRR